MNIPSASSTRVILAALLLLLAGPLPCALAASPADFDEAVQRYRQRQDDATPGEILDWLKNGNRRFTAGVAEHGGYPSDARERVQVSATGQRPLVAVLSCIDSRTSPELVFDVSVGDLFTARVGANVINDDVLGSLEIAAASGARVILVLGHTGCGGVMGALDGLQLGHVTAMLGRVRPAIALLNARLDADPVLSREVGERVTKNRRYVAEVSHANARRSFEQILAESPVVKAMVDKGEVLLVSAVFDVDTGVVAFDPIR